MTTNRSHAVLLPLLLASLARLHIAEAAKHLRHLADSRGSSRGASSADRAKFRNLADGAARHKEKQKQKQKQTPPPPCTCEDCKGERLMRDQPTEGFKGFQCKPNQSGESKGTCTQQGNRGDWVVQTSRTPEIDYTRFCHFTCKPVLPMNIQPEYGCTQLSAQEVKLMGQSPSGNGKSYIYHSNPMTDSLTLDDITQGAAPPQVRDPIANMQKAYAEANR